MNWREDRTLMVLCFFTVLYTLVLLLILWWKPNDAAAWQVFAGILTGFIGALGLHLKGDKAPPAGSTTVTTIDQVTKIPPTEPPA